MAVKLIIRLESESVLFLGEAGQKASSGAAPRAAVYTHALYTALGADPFTLVFSHVVESGKSTNTRNLVPDSSLSQ